jgi:hypothetical protein
MHFTSSNINIIITFKDIQNAIIKANKSPPIAKKFAWSHVYKLSEEFKKQEDKLKMNKNKIDE